MAMKFEQQPARWGHAISRAVPPRFVLGAVALSGGFSHFIIIALQEATLLSTPRLTYQ